jgi:hypothetical protein
LFYCSSAFRADAVQSEDVQMDAEALSAVQPLH